MSRDKIVTICFGGVVFSGISRIYSLCYACLCKVTVYYAHTFMCKVTQCITHIHTLIHLHAFHMHIILLCKVHSLPSQSFSNIGLFVGLSICLFVQSFDLNIAFFFSVYMFLPAYHYLISLILVMCVNFLCASFCADLVL